MSVDDGTTSYLHTPKAHLGLPSNMTLEEIMGSGNGSSAIPTATALNEMADKINRDYLPRLRNVNQACDRGMRQLAEKRKEHAHLEQERAGREDEERKHKPKKPTKKSDKSEERPLAVGAHGLARQDGVDVHEDTNIFPFKDASSSLSPTSSPSTVPATATATNARIAQEDGSRSSSEEPHQPPPAKPIQQYPTFGPDPTKFDDPTIYEIREIYEGIPEEERKEILNVALYPASDLHDLTCGTPPDKDYSNGKAQNQTSFDAFLKYQEPYTRPLIEEDLAFLRERGDRIQPFIMPRRGPRHYKEIWTEEDGGMMIDGTEPIRPSQNEPRGTIEDINDEIAETSEVSAGPMVSRLLQMIRPQPFDIATLSIGESSANGATNGDANGEGESNVNTDENNRPATFLPEFGQPGYKPPNPPASNFDYAEMDARLKQELQYIGFLPSSTNNPAPADFDAHYDDEVAARLRYLQNELRWVSQVNGARKARILETTEERMAQQEYSTIADDLDNQLNQAYLKRNRNIGKGGKNKNKRPGAGGTGGGSHVAVPTAGLSRPGVGDSIRSLMDRKAQWNGIIGPVVQNGQTSIPNETIFDDESMKRLGAREVESWNEVEE
ncbi:MAG: hypothetical protein Q9157_008897 [Trypethelium eluteriae]